MSKFGSATFNSIQTRVCRPQMNTGKQRFLMAWEDNSFKDYQPKIENWYARGNIIQGFHPLGDSGAIFKYKVVILEILSFTDVAAVVWTNTI